MSRLYVYRLIISLVLAAVSRNVMNHLQLKRDENRRRRAALMTDSLNTFVTADAHIKPSFENAAERSRSNSESTLFPSRDDEQRESCQVDCDGQHPFVCAAKLLCDSLDLGNRGSVLFLDTVNGVKVRSTYYDHFADVDSVQRRQQIYCGRTVSRVGHFTQQHLHSPSVHTACTEL